MQIELMTVNQEARIDSRHLASLLGNKHKNVLGLLDDYLADFQRLGAFAFKTEVRAGQRKSGGGLPARWAELNEDQCYFLLTLVRNSETTVPLKRQLVQAFASARKGLLPSAASAAPALPSDPLELLTLSVQAMQQQKVQLQVLEHRLDTAPIRMDSKKRGAIHAACQRYARVHPAGYAGAYREFKGMFSNDGIPLAAYDDLPSHRYQEALEWLDMQIRVRGGAGLFDEASD